MKARVRGLQTHDEDVSEVRVGFRAAVNLAGVESGQIERGMVLVQPDLYQPVEIVNARLSVLGSSPVPVKNNQRIRLHIHTNYSHRPGVETGRKRLCSTSAGAGGSRRLPGSFYHPPVLSPTHHRRGSGIANRSVPLPQKIPKFVPGNLAALRK